MSEGPLSRQPDKLDYLSPTQFRFGINQLPKVEFFTTAANIPGINMGEAMFDTPFKNFGVMGDKLTYENLEITFIVDEFLEKGVDIVGVDSFTYAGRRKNMSTFIDKIKFYEVDICETQKIKEILVDCDSDAIIYLVEPSGPACHTGEKVCFHNNLK